MATPMRSAGTSAGIGGSRRRGHRPCGASAHSTTRSVPQNSSRLTAEYQRPSISLGCIALDICQRDENGRAAAADDDHPLPVKYCGAPRNLPAGTRARYMRVPENVVVGLNPPSRDSSSRFELPNRYDHPSGAVCTAEPYCGETPLFGAGPKWMTSNVFGSYTPT